MPDGGFTFSLPQVFDAERFDDGCADIALEPVRNFWHGVLEATLDLHGNRCLRCLRLGMQVLHPDPLAFCLHPCRVCALSTMRHAHRWTSCRQVHSDAGEQLPHSSTSQHLPPFSAQAFVVSAYPANDCTGHAPSDQVQAAAGQTLDGIRQQLAAAGHGATVLRRVKLVEYRGEQLLEVCGSICICPNSVMGLPGSQPVGLCCLAATQ